MKAVVVALALGLAGAGLSQRAVTPVPVTEWAQPGAERITVVYVARIPGVVRARDAAALDTLETVLLRGGTRVMGGPEWLAAASQAGVAPRAVRGDDWFAVQVTVPEGAQNLGIQLVAQVVTGARLSDFNVVPAVDAQRGRERDLWDVWRTPGRLDRAKLMKEDVRAWASQIFQPGNGRLIVAGAIQSGTAQAEADRRFRDYQPRLPIPRLRQDETMPEKGVPGAAGLYEWRGPILKPTLPDLGPRLLALMALGTGKSSSLHRVFREENGWSYWQTLVLWPVADGWRPRLSVLRASAVDGTWMEGGEEALRADIATWDEGTVMRARGMLQMSLMRGSVLSPFWVKARPFAIDDLEDAALFRAHLALAGVTTFAPGAILESTADVTPERLKELATQMLDQSSVLVIPPRDPQPVEPPDRSGTPGDGGTD